MAHLRHIHRFMANRQVIRLEDGRVGKIVRIDTEFPRNQTTVSVWTETERGPGLAKVDLSDIVGPARERESA
jgi:hypothetical protein